MTSPDHPLATPVAQGSHPAEGQQPTLPRPGLYRHYKGGLYTVICTGRHSETEEWLVTYRSEARGDYWVRPLAMWVEYVDDQPRFALIEPTNTP